MSKLLTPRQAEELHKTIIAYLSSNDLAHSANALREELNIGDSFSEETSKKYEGIMERKWTSIIRLQKKIMDLESENYRLKQELETSTPTSFLRGNQDPATWLPRAPARHTLQSHRSPVTCVAFHPIFSSLASGSEDSTIKIWDWELGELERTVKGHTKAVLDVDYGGPRGGMLLASCSSDLTIKLWDPSDEYKNIRTLPGHDHSVSAVRFISSGSAGLPSTGNLLVSASRDKTLRIWDVTTGYCVKTLSGHLDWVREVTPSFDGRWLLSGGNDQTARLWDAASGEIKATFLGHEHVIECCAFAPPTAYGHLAALAGLKKPPLPSSSGEFVATGSRDRKIKLWDGRGTLIKTLDGHDNWVRGMVFHPGGRYLISVSDDKTMRCWDLEQEGKCVKTISDAHGHFISCIRWAPSISNEPSAVNGDTPGRPSNSGKGQELAAAKANIRCVIATGSVDLNVRIFAS
ncbi:platelet-activating factor acetylhydrolase IB alpha subunit [Xylona heveae TC161]|uniref:Nuclear distribution protein PAC1 n=1 Tax=Xylona heveae (strain CBS 132557 / TC161) TaxID=1328760 RepID=A0A165IGR3_XYLHT|nr:platelet-activating factor acetylhydrolase IB alpha subunit [Xylona heveae TC161]KZF24871.1 platelet-activating factor acetylhydrolase IB alpha subunit [Xylona heveae TC161]